MILKVFSLYDSKGKAFGPPAFFNTRGLAIRSLKDAVESGEGALGKHPEDFVMYEIAEWNDNTGEYINKNPHELVSMASDHKKEVPIPVDLKEVLSKNQKIEPKVVS